MIFSEDQLESEASFALRKLRNMRDYPKNLFYTAFEYLGVKKLSTYFRAKGARPVGSIPYVITPYIVTLLFLSIMETRWDEALDAILSLLNELGGLALFRALPLALLICVHSIYTYLLSKLFGSTARFRDVWRIEAYCFGTFGFLIIIYLPFLLLLVNQDSIPLLAVQIIYAVVALPFQLVATYFLFRLCVVTGNHIMSLVTVGKRQPEEVSQVKRFSFFLLSIIPPPVVVVTALELFADGR